jgi:hypothetical protein
MKRVVKHIVFIFMLAISQVVTGQSYTQMVEFADEKMIEGDYFYAINYYQKAMNLDSNSVEINWKMAEAQRKYKNYVLAEYYYQKVFNKENGKIYPYSIFWLATMQHYNGKYAEAFGNWKTSKKMFKSKRKEYAYIKSLAEFKSCLWAKKAVLDTTEFEVNQLPNNVNSFDSELAPFVFDNTLYFTSLKADSIKNNEELITEEYNLQVYTSDIEENEYKKPSKLDNIYKSGMHSANGCFSPDGTRFYFTRCNENYNCKIYVGKVIEGKIIDIDSLGDVINEVGANTTMPNLAQIDGKEILFFASNRLKTMGGLDIWYSEIKNGNQYSKPRNLGRNINSLDDDITPFYDTINDRLYFSSSWHPGFGGHDIFYAPKIEGNLTFNKPVNIGLPINSSQNDTYFTIDQTNKKYYFSSNRIGSNSIKTPTCCNDIFVVNLESPKESPPRFVNLDHLNKKLPVTLYFHNDEPNPRTRDTVTNLTYMESYSDYMELVPKYKKEYSQGLIGDNAEEAKEDINDFFIEFVEQGVADLNEFTRLLLIELEKGNNIQVTVKGFASPLAKTDYNVNLTKRRISSLINYLNEYGSGEFVPYLNQTATNGGGLTFVQIPFGEYTANKLISDNVNDQQNSVYSRKAALERKIEIQSVSLVSKDSSYAEIQFDSEIHDFGKANKGIKLEHSFELTNTGTDTLIINDIQTECGCTEVELAKRILLPGETAILMVTLNTTTLSGLSVRKIIIHTNSKGGKKEISLTTEVF